MEIKIQAPHAIDASITHWLVSAQVVAHVEFQGAVHKKKKKDTPNYLRLYFPTGKAEPVMTGTVVDAEAA